MARKPAVSKSSNPVNRPAPPGLGRRWQLQHAKAQLSRLLKDAQKEPQVITLHGEEVAVVQSMEHYRKDLPSSESGPNLFEALLKCPPGPPLVIDRDPSDVVGAGTPNIFER